MKTSNRITDSKIIHSYPAISILKGVLPTDTINNISNYLEDVNDNSAATSLAANISGDQSNLDVKHPLMKDFFEEMLQGCCTYQNFMSRNVVGVSSQHRTMILNCCWSVKMNPNDYNPMHIHGTNSISGLATICYIKVPEHIKQDVLKSREGHVDNGKGMTDGLLQFNWHNQNTGSEDDYCPTIRDLIIPVVGDYYVFPKWLSHTVYPYRGTEQRWSVQTNFDVYTNEELELRNSFYNESTS